MIRVVRTQISYLADLRQILQTSYSGERGGNRNLNTLKIPYLSTHREQTTILFHALDEVIAEREQFYRELTIWVEHCRLSFTQNALDKQGRSISIFTLISSIFLPLGFLASVSPQTPTSVIREPE